jgi:hypothetical protein
MPINNALTPEGQNALGAAFGYYPQLRRNRQFNDPVASAEMPLQFMRSRFASTMGAIPDLMNLKRSLLPAEAVRALEAYGQIAPEVPYGSQYFQENLPLPPQGPAQQMAGTVGSFVPMSPMEALQAARLARQAALAGGKVAKKGARLVGEELNAAMLGERQGTMLGAITPQPRFIFVGESSKTWNKADATKALEMEKAGAKPEDIWATTGTFRGPEGKLRQEISDKGSKITDEVFNQISANKEFKGPISQALTHEELYNAYPQASQIPAVMFADETPSGNILRGKEGTFQVPQLTAGGPSTMAQRSVALHELQHAVQQKEGFARGGNINEFASGPMFDKTARDLTADLSQIVTGGVSAKPLEVLQGLKYTDPKDIEPIIKKYGFKNIDEVKSFIYDENERRTPLGQYQRLAGEAEARAVQARRQMTPEERRAKFPYESYDVPLNQLIIRK